MQANPNKNENNTSSGGDKGYCLDVAVIGVPLCHGQPRAGTETGPSDLRNAGLVSKLTELGVNVKDTGDVACDPVAEDPAYEGVKKPRSVGASNENLSKRVFETISSGHIALTLGGDHSLAIGSIHGHLQAKPDACVVWIDAHADINTPLTSTSGNIHGMPVSFLLHELKDFVPGLPGFEWMNTVLSTKSLAYIGIRDVDPGEACILNKFEIPYFSMHEVDKFGIHYCVKRSLELINPGMDRPIHLSFDIDALSSSEAPCTGTPVAGGLTLREGTVICEELASTGLLSAIDLVEVNTVLSNSKEDHERTVNAALQLIQACFGSRRAGNYSESYELSRVS